MKSQNRVVFIVVDNGFDPPVLTAHNTYEAAFDSLTPEQKRNLELAADWNDNHPRGPTKLTDVYIEELKYIVITGVVKVDN